MHLIGWNMLLIVMGHSACYAEYVEGRHSDFWVEYGQQNHSPTGKMLLNGCKSC